jgi:hypothetical protein
MTDLVFWSLLLDGGVSALRRVVDPEYDKWIGEPREACAYGLGYLWSLSRLFRNEGTDYG